MLGEMLGITYRYGGKGRAVGGRTDLRSFSISMMEGIEKRSVMEVEGGL